MGKITKTVQSKHLETLSSWLGNYVQSATTIPLPLLPKHLSEYPSRWPFGRGDLYHWIPLLNRFDSILEKFCSIYELDKGPQLRDFGCELLLNHSGDEQLNGTSQWRESLPADFQIPTDGDRQLIEAILKFTRMLLEHCGNRSIYASSGHLNDLLNSTCWRVLIATLEVGSELAQRYQASVRRIGNTSRQISSALLTNHYNIDLERVLQMASPFVKTPIIGLVDIPAVASSSKGKEKAHVASVNNPTSIHANDLAALASSDATDAKVWTGWGDVKVSYYPQDGPSNQGTRVEPGRSSQPSTPTPLRRSSTTNPQHQTTPRTRNILGDESSPLGPRTPGLVEDSATSGQKTFELPQSIVASSSIPSLLSRCPDDMAPTTKYEIFNRLRVAKAVMEAPDTRRQVLAARLLAITNLAYIHSEGNFVEKVLRHDADETRRFQLVYQLVELIRPSADGAAEVPLWLQTIALALLEAVSNFNARCQDVLSALNANVNHGVLLYVIRKAVGGMKTDDGSEDSGSATESDHWRNNLFSLTLYLSMHTRVGVEMVSAGLIEILVEMLKIRSAIAQRHHAMVIAFLDGLIWTYQNAFNAFFNANGLDAVATLVVDTVKEAQSLTALGRGTQPDHRSSAVDYKIPYYQQQTLRWLLKFVHHIMSNSYSYSGNTDRLLRNLADKSDLLQSLREVMADKQSFGSVDWTNSVTILSDFINNDPTSFTVILDSGMIKTYLEAITGQPIQADLAEQPKTEDGEEDESDSTVSSALLAEIEDDDRPHPPTDELLRQTQRDTLANGVLPTSEAINVVPQVLNSISLNNAGMKLVVSSRAFDKFFEIFESPDHVTCMASDSELAGNVGASFDELARHHPALKTSIANAIIDMVARVRFLGIEKSRTAGWGAKLVVRASDGKIVSVSSDGTYGDVGNLSTSEDVPLTSSDADVHMADANPIQVGTHEKSSENGSKKAPEDAFTPYIYAVSSFLATCLSNNLLRASFADKGGIEILLDICESPSLGPNFNDSLASRMLGQVVSQMVEFSPIRGLPSILNRAQAAIDVLEPIASKRVPIPAYFAPFLNSNVTVPHTDKEVWDVLSKGNNMIKAFINAQSLFKIMSECFLSSRGNTLTFYPINVYDHFLRLINSIGPLYPGILAEEAGQLSMVPQNWSSNGDQSLEDLPRSTTTPDIEPGASLLPDTLSWKAQGSGHEQPTIQEQASPQFRNYETFRKAMHPLIPTTFPFFQSLGRALFPRREQNQGDLYPRPRQIEIARALANATLSHLRTSVAATEHTSKDFHYWIIMLHTINAMLVDHPSPRHTDRGSPQLIIPVLLAFKEEGGLDVLDSMLQVFASCIRQGSETDSEESSKPKIASFGLKKVLDIYFILSNGKTVTEASTGVNLQRQTDRGQTVPNIFQQFVVELRASILPSIMELWDSSIVENLAEPTVKRLIDILKLISAAEYEPTSTPSDKVPFFLLQYTDSRFNWRAVRRAVDELLSEDFNEDLIHEAVFRANGHTITAREYCRAHRGGVAGPPNPIPPEESDISDLVRARNARADRTPSHGTASSDVDRMSLDDSASMSGDNTADLVDRPTQAIDDGVEASASSNREDVTGQNRDNAGAVSQASQSTQFVATKEGLDKQRDDLRKDLIDRCLDVIRTHPNCAIEVSELISAMVIRQQNQETHEEVCTTLTSALSSLPATDEEDIKRNGKCIASYAHLLGLLLQDETFFQHNVDLLRGSVDDYISLLKVPSSAATSELPPWVPYILLILEAFLRHDERPIAAQWKPPKSLDEQIQGPVLHLPAELVDKTKRQLLVDSILNLLRRIGKEEVIATSVLRLLVILTRSRPLAKHVGDKKNLQLLFLMTKQLVASGSEKLKQSKLTQHIMTILRHIIEDEDILRQVMRAEIKRDFLNITRGQRNQPDLTSYLRHFGHLALRAPDIFVEVTNDMVEITKWNVSSGESGRGILCLKELVMNRSDSDKVAEDPATDISGDKDVKQSTEPADKDMGDVHRPQDSKRPLVENPDGVVHFLLSELINYREVDDKEVPAPSKDAEPEAESSEQDAANPRASDGSGGDKREKKPQKPVFKSEEHPIFIYRCFLLNCLTELLQSYNRTKVEFINFKRSAPPLPASTPVKPRSSVLNYLIYDLLCQTNLSGATDSIAAKKKAATSTHTQKLLVSLVSKTKERPVSLLEPKFAYDDEPDLQFVRKFVLDTILKAYERAPGSDEPLETRYSRMQSLAELMNQMVGERDKEHGLSSRGPDGLQARSQMQIRRMMYEKSYLEKLTSSIAEINLNYPGVKRAIKYILRVLRVLTDTAKELSQSDFLPANNTSESVDDDVYSSSSLSDLEDDREETPDLYRNSSLGMLEPRGHDESEEDDDDADDLYGDEYDDEMDYEEDGISDDDQDNISEDSEMGEIEGLPGEPNVVEVIMDEDEDDDDDDDESDEDDDEDDDLDSDDMEDVESRVEIVNEDGQPMEDDGASGWESEDAEDEELEADLDYEAEVQDADEAHLHGLVPPPAGLLNNMARALMEGDEYDPDLMDEHYLDDGHDDDEEEDEEEDIDDEEYIYDDDYPLDEEPPPMPAIGWDDMNPDVDRNRLILLDNNGQSRRRVLTRMDNRSPFPPGQGFVVGSHTGGEFLGDFRSYFSRQHRSNGPNSNTDDGVNPLLRRQDQRQDAPTRPGHQHGVGVRLPDGLLGGLGGRHGIDAPMGFLGELMDILPVMGRGGQALHFHITGHGAGQTRDILPPRGSRHDQRRETTIQDPYQAVTFGVQSTLERYQDEARMIFGAAFALEATKLSNIITARLMPAAVAAEKKRQAEEAERKKRAEEERIKREEEERRIREKKEAEEKAAREKKEAEEREASERAAAAAAALDRETQAQPSPGAQTASGGAMEGVEQGSTSQPPATTDSTTVSSSQPRVMAMLGDQEIDVTDLGIDPDYLAALPEEFREEVIAQTVSARRSEARAEAPAGETAAFQEFLDALPPQLRREIEQQEAQEQRRRDNGNSRPAATVASARPSMHSPDMDTASILLTFPPELREQVLLEQGDEIMDQLPPEMAEQARRLRRGTHTEPYAVPAHRPSTSSRRLYRPQESTMNESKPQRRTVVQMLDKAGVATLVRLMFIAHQGSIRTYLFGVFADVCENRQNRLEVISTILQLLQEGSTDMTAVDRSFGHLSLKARRHKEKEKEAEQKTPQSLKRTLTNISTAISSEPNSETSPLLIVQQCLDLLGELCAKSPHIPILFLTEHEAVGSTLKRTLSRKGKGKDNKAHKYAINSLLALLDRDLVMESSVVMTHLADLLNRVTLPLQNLERRRIQEEKAANASKAEGAVEAGGAAGEEGSQASKTPTDAKPNEEPGQSSAGQDGAEGGQSSASQKKARELQAPVIPPQNLTLVVRVFVARECSSKTFQNTISTIKNLSAVPGASSVFGQELVRQARLLSENIVSDLDELLPHIEKATSGTEIQGVALAKFSPGASEQNKLLRVLTALDHLFDGKKQSDGDGQNPPQTEKHDLVISLYHNSTFSAMWEKLSACLTAIHERENMLNVATILLPLIESLMVVCKNTTTQDDPSQNQAGKEMVLSSPPPESRTASLFFSFTESHRRVLNELVRHNPKLMSGTFALLVKNPKVLEFDNKRNYFNRSVHSRTGQPNHGRPSFPTLNLSVRRDQVFHDSFRSLYFKSGDEMKFGKLNIRFHGEEGVDAGGVTREWFQVLSRQMFDPNYALFIPVSSDRTTFHPNKLSGINDEHLSFFKFIGRVIGKALYEGRVLDCYFSRAVYKRILGKSVSVKDMESFDPDYYKSLCWMLENDITDIITETFSVEDEEFGVTNVVDLTPGGRDIAVTEENKHEYVRLVVEHKLLSSVKEQMENFLKGFHDIIPAELISIFNEQELELLISGLPEIDVDDWKSNTEYQNYNPSSPQIQWFWRAVRSFDKEERAKLLQFVTGTSKVPLNGFKELEGMNGVNRFNIHRDYGNKDRLPSSHTCFNQLDLPEYENYDALRTQLVKAITAGSEYFGFA